MLLNGNLVVAGQVKDLKVEQLAADPTGGQLTLSRTWYNTVEKTMKFYDGVAVQSLAIGGNLSAYVEHDGSVAMSGQLTLVGDPVADDDAARKAYVDAADNTKQDILTGATSNLTGTNLTASKATVSDATGKLISATSTTSAQVEYLSDVTSLIQNQIDGKEATIGYVPVNQAGDALDTNASLVFSGTGTVTGLAAPVNATDAVRKVDMETALAGLDFQGDIIERQEDGTLDPSATPVTGDRYIIGDIATLHANFGVIAGVGNGDIVEFDGVDFQVVYDVSVGGEGALCWNETQNFWMSYNGTVWGEFGGLSGVTVSTGLAKTGNTIRVLLGAGIGNLPTGEVGVEVLPDSGLFNTVDGIVEDILDTNAKLAIKLNANGLETVAAGLGIAASGVTETEIAATALGNGLTGAGGTTMSVVPHTGVTVTADGVGLDLTYADNRYINVDGDALTAGDLTLFQDPSLNMHATTKQYVDGLVSTAGGDTATLSTRVDNGLFVYDAVGVPATTHTVTHNLGNQFAAIVVLDQANEQVMVDTVTFTDSNSLVVTTTTAEEIKVVVMGVKAPVA